MKRKRADIEKLRRASEQSEKKWCEMLFGYMQCAHCAHDTNDIKPRSCKAFDWIPDEILLGFDHTKPYPGDKGIRFKPKTNMTDGSQKKNGKKNKTTKK